MNYKGQILYVGTLGESREDFANPLYQGDILCVETKAGLFDLIGNNIYHQYALLNGENFIQHLHYNLSSDFNENIYFYRTLLKLAMALNRNGYSIAIPRNDSCKIKKKK